MNPVRIKSCCRYLAIFVLAVVCVGCRTHRHSLSCDSFFLMIRDSIFCSKATYDKRYGDRLLCRDFKLQERGFVAEGTASAYSPDGICLKFVKYQVQEDGTLRMECLFPWEEKPQKWIKDMLANSTGVVGVKITQGDKVVVDAVVSLREAMKKRQENSLGRIYCGQYRFLLFDTIKLDSRIPLKISVSVVEPDPSFSDLDGAFLSLYASPILDK